MNGRKIIFLGAGIAVLIAAIVYMRNAPAPVPVTTPSAQSDNPMETSDPAANLSDSDSDSPRSDTAAVNASADDNSADGHTFHADSAGNLVLNERTRLNIETFVAQTEQREWDAAMREQTDHLPPPAARLVEELVAKFVIYQQAQKQAYPPDDVPATPEDAVRQLEGLHALREAHFGPQVAERFYGQEEIVARELIEVMRVENDQSLTPEERAERARALRERLPGVSAIEKGNRDSDAARTK